MAASKVQPVVISSTVTKSMIIVALLVWVFFATSWLASMTSGSAARVGDGCTMTLLSRSRRDPLVSELTATEHSDQVATAKRHHSLQWPTNKTVESEDEKVESIARHYWSQMDKTKSNKQQGCTLVMQTYKREKILPKVLTHYCNISLLQRILVIWNDVDTAVPQALFNLTRGCKAELMYIISRENKLTNRYIPRREIETDCVCLMDDDRIIAEGDMKFGYEVWKRFHHRIVGFEERSFVKGPKGNYIYTNYERRRFFNINTGRTSKGQTHLPPGYSIEIKDGVRLLHVRNKTFILGKTSESNSGIVRKTHYAPSGNATEKSEGYNIMLNSCFIHRLYLEMYCDPSIIPSSLLEYVNQQMNCEDILMSVVVTKFLKDVGRPQSGVLAVKSNWIGNLEEEAREEGDKGLSAREDHYKARSACLNKFADAYGYLPLHTSKVVLTKVLYHL